MRPPPYGKISLGGLLLLAVIVGGIYSVWTFTKPVLDNLDVKEAIDVAYNQRGQRRDDELKAVIIQRLSRVGTHFEEDPFGNVVEMKGLGVSPEDITIERNDVSGTIFIQVDYERVVPLPPSEKTWTLRFRPQKEGPL